MPALETATATDGVAEEIRRLALGTVRTVSGTTDTLLAADNGCVVAFNSSSAVTVTVPSGLGANFACRILQLGTGQVSIAPGSGVTLNSYSAQRRLLGQFTSADLWAYADDTFILEGATVP